APRALSEAWFDAYWVLLDHATRSALAVALLPLVWRWFEIEDFSQTALTSFVIMFVPHAVVREGRHQTMIERMTHRAAGCLLGNVVALASLSALGDTLLPSLPCYPSGFGSATTFRMAAMASAMLAPNLSSGSWSRWFKGQALSPILRPVSNASS